jgi:hypothetical protein
MIVTFPSRLMFAMKGASVSTTLHERVAALDENRRYF